MPAGFKSNERCYSLSGGLAPQSWCGSVISGFGGRSGEDAEMFTAIVVPPPSHPATGSSSSTCSGLTLRGLRWNDHIYTPSLCMAVAYNSRMLVHDPYNVKAALYFRFLIYLNPCGIKTHYTANFISLSACLLN